jgi:phosphate-selective porin OprO and OprP
LVALRKIGATDSRLSEFMSAEFPGPMLARSNTRLPRVAILLVIGYLTSDVQVARCQATLLDQFPAAVNTPSVVVPELPEPRPVPAIDLQQRLQAMEAANRALTERMERLSRDHQAWRTQLLQQIEELSDPQDAAPGPWLAEDSTEGQTVLPGTDPGRPPGYRADYDPAIPDYTDLDIESPYEIPQEIIFGPGFQIQSADARFRLQIHYESQIEARIWSQEDQLPANSGFFLPRQRFFFRGNITEVTEYELAINRGVNNINLLNAFINFRFDDRFMLRIGRFFTPMLYDQYAISNYWLLVPERSLFTTNLSLNRQIGMMAWGYLLDKQLDYAAGIFNGSRNSFESLNCGVDFVGYLNARPFQNADIPLAKNWNVGASMAYGSQDQAPVPRAFRVGAGSPDANIPGIATVPFLILNPGVLEQGERLIGSVHMAYFYRSLTAIGEWQYGYGNYALPADPASEKVPFTGFYVGLGYFLTGEHIERRTRVQPLRPFAPIDAQEPRGPGAWEVVSRVSQLRLGDEIFSAGLADPTIWSNTATTTEVGANWYLNDYMKLYLCWLHARFDDPVQYRPGSLQKHADMLWVRCQLYF